MKRAVSVSLGSPRRDKQVQLQLNGQRIQVERIGTGGDAERARQLFIELDGRVDALSVGGIDLYVTLDGRDYPIHAALKMVQGVTQTPLVDGRMLKYVMERRVFELARPLLGETPHFCCALMPTAIDRIGLAEAITPLAEQVVMGDLLFMLGIPIMLHGLTQFKRVARWVLPLAGRLPMSILLPPGSQDQDFSPKQTRYWQAADLIAGDLHSIRQYSPPDLSGKTVITNTTTPENIELLQQRGVTRVITLSPRFDGRSFGTNVMEAMLTAYAGLGRPLTPAELNVLVEELGLRPELLQLN